MKLITAFVLALSLIGSGCAKAPPNLTPQAVVAFHATQAITVLDHVRDAADNAHKTTPPLISAQVNLKVATWHESAVTIAHEAKHGWQKAVIVGLDGLQHDLVPSDWAIVAPYVALAKTILTEVSQ